MVAVLLAFFFFILLVFLVRTFGKAHFRSLMWLLGAAYLSRFLVLAVTPTLQLFSHGAGGDWNIYEWLALTIVKLWERYGFFYVTSDDIAYVGNTSLPPNVFALIFFLNGGESTWVGGTALVAFLTCVNSLNFYLLGIELGAEQKKVFLITTCMLFAPSFFFYTSHMYKDGMVLFATFGALSSAIRLTRKFSFTHFLFGIFCCALLWGIRHYLIFAVLAALVGGLAGFGSKSFMRQVFFWLLLSTLFVILFASSNVIGDLSERGRLSFESGTSDEVIAANASGGSGVIFDQGNSIESLPPKLLYTLLSPFPWQSGSFGLNIGKIDAVLFAYLLYRAAYTVKSLWSTHKNLVIPPLLFIFPMTIAYSLGMSNIGLIVRQRMPLVFATALLAMMGWQEKQEDESF